MDANTAMTVTKLTGIIAAVGALGTAAFGLVDAFKVLPGGGISRAGFKFIRQAIVTLTPQIPELEKTGLSRDAILTTLLSQWINGTTTADQVNIAKSLIKLRLTPDTAPSLANTTAVDSPALSEIAKNMNSGTALSSTQSDVYGRFDLMLTTLLDQAYQRADQRYRNAAKSLAIPVAVVLAILAAHFDPTHQVTTAQAFVVGLIATPIAPIAKDVSTAIATAAQAVQKWSS